LFLLFSSLLVSFIFMTMNHPLAMGLVLLCQTLLLSLLTGLFASTFWFSYILFLVFLGGMLVLFIYVTSLASNEMFSISSKALLLSGFSLSVILFSVLLNDPTIWSSPNSSDQSSSFILTLSTTISGLLIKLYSAPTHLLTLLLVIYLFLTLVAAVTVTNIYEGPLRSKY
uniref:NADH dehydrogenase subunit 6 n=1 Tax=Paegniodes cupulatus TaxID=747259 RepID=UPI002176B858